MPLEDDPEFKAIRIEKHKDFLVHVNRGSTAAEAYRLTYPKAKKQYSGKRGYELRKKYNHILERHITLPPTEEEALGERTLENLTRMAFADVADMLGRDGQPLPINEIPVGLRMAITEVELNGKRVRYKIGGKLKALEVLTRIAKLEGDSPLVHISLGSEGEREQRIYEILERAGERKAPRNRGESD